jgi:enoyl-CoA hydratase/carnithine racemase
MLVVRAELAPPAARRLVMQAELIDAELALELAAFDELLEPGEVLPRAHELALGLAAMPRDAYSVVKRQLRGATIDEIDAAIERDPMASGWLSGDAEAAARAALDH